MSARTSRSRRWRATSATDSVLLVLDNFEHVAEAGPFLVDLISTCPELKVLVTSRARLRLSGETECVLAPLAAADAARSLRRSRAGRQSRPGARGGRTARRRRDLRRAGRPSARDRARRCADEAAFPEAIRARLGERLELLTAGPRDLPARQQALRDTLDWSYALLDPDERRLFARLGVFAGGFTLESAEAICATSLDEHRVARRQQPRPQRTGSASRCSRRSASTRARGSPKAVSEDESRRAHAAHYLAFAEAAAPELTGPDQAAWLRRLERDHDNLRAALHYSLDSRLG